ncbi:MAG: hypothetical protein WCC31_09350 [Terracidiphilus sp.]
MKRSFHPSFSKSNAPTLQAVMRRLKALTPETPVDVQVVVD